jgi:hypothetical protein
MLYDINNVISFVTVRSYLKKKKKKKKKDNNNNNNKVNHMQSNNNNKKCNWNSTGVYLFILVLTCTLKSVIHPAL